MTACRVSIGSRHQSEATVPRVVAPERGFSLIEVMVTIVIVSFGLLGLAGMMFSSLTAGQVSMSRSVAVNLSNEMADRIRSNWKAVKAGAFDEVEKADYADQGTACSTACITGVCDPETQAALDVCLWKKQIGKQLPGGLAEIEADPANLSCATASAACSFSVTVYWNESGYRETNADSAQFSVAETSYSVLVQP